MSEKVTEQVQPRWLNWLPESLRRVLWQNGALRALLENTSWLMGERVVNMTIRFFVGVWVVRYLGPEQYGVYSYALSFVGLFTAISTLGLDNIVIRNLSSEKWSEGEVMGTAFTLRMAAGVLTMGAVGAAVLSVNDDWTTQLAVLIVSGQLVFKSANVFKLWFKSEIKSKYPVWVRSGVVMVNSAAQVVFILLGLPVIAFLILYLIQTSMKSVGTFLMYQLVSEKGKQAWTFRWCAARTMMKDAWPLIIAGLSVAAYMKIDQVMLGKMVGDSAVGIYATAVKMSNLWYFIPMAIAGSVFPKIVSSKENKSKKIYEKRIQLFYDIMAIVSYIVIVPVAVSATPLIELLFGVEYSASASILRLHIWAFLFVSLDVARGKWLVAENLTNFAMYASMLGAAVNIGLNIVLIPDRGGGGAAIATLLSQVVATYLACLLFKRTRKLFMQLTWSIFAPLRIGKLKNGITKYINE